jgi:hypothetical protein
LSLRCIKILGICRKYPLPGDYNHEIPSQPSLDKLSQKAISTLDLLRSEKLATATNLVPMSSVAPKSKFIPKYVPPSDLLTLIISGITSNRYVVAACEDAMLSKSDLFIAFSSA